MSDELNPPLQSLPVANYSSAIARAVEWLGDRYLLARPVKALHREALAVAHSSGTVPKSQLDRA
jgi:hypothetical protein